MCPCISVRGCVRPSISPSFWPFLRRSLEPELPFFFTPDPLYLRSPVLPSLSSYVEEVVQFVLHFECWFNKDEICGIQLKIKRSFSLFRYSWIRSKSWRIGDFHDENQVKISCSISNPFFQLKLVQQQSCLRLASVWYRKQNWVLRFLLDFFIG